MRPRHYRLESLDLRYSTPAKIRDSLGLTYPEMLNALFRSVRQMAEDLERRLQHSQKVVCGLSALYIAATKDQPPPL
jgi:hypothetical protein